jgi:hypothetical protein
MNSLGDGLQRQDSSFAPLLAVKRPSVLVHIKWLVFAALAEMLHVNEGIAVGGRGWIITVEWQEDEAQLNEVISCISLRLSVR